MAAGLEESGCTGEMCRIGMVRPSDWLRQRDLEEAILISGLGIQGQGSWLRGSWGKRET